MSRPIFRGISPSVAEFNPLARAKIREAMDLFKQVVRPIMVGSRVYHHTPITPLFEPSPWVVLEYAAQDRQRAVVSLFRTAQTRDATFRFLPRGLDFERVYRIRLCNENQVVEIPGSRLIQEGIPIRLENALDSEMLIFESKS